MIVIDGLQTGNAGIDAVRQNNFGQALTDEVLISKINDALAQNGAAANVYHSDTAPGPSSWMLAGAVGLAVGALLVYALKKG